MSPGWSGTILAPCLFTGHAWHNHVRINLENGRIVALDLAPQPASNDADCVLADDLILAPGFIDTQVNGGGDALLNDAPALATIAKIAAAHRRFGTTGLLPTLITDTSDKLESLLAIAPAAHALPGVHGLHLEGPFLNPVRRGVHREDLIRRPTATDLALLLRFAAQGRTLVTLAPEQFTPAQLAELSASGLILSAGHSTATSADMRAAADAGLRGVTHLFNAMSQIGPRDGGVVGAALDDARLCAGIIADGHHVSESNLRLAYKLLAPDRLMLVSDAMPTAGGQLTHFDLQGRKIALDGGVLKDQHGTLAGAHLTMIAAVQHLAASIGDGRQGLTAALIAASRTPARFLGLGATHGVVAPGYHADFVAFHRETFKVHGTWLHGHFAPAEQMGQAQ